jgi:uncharacterized protein (DUF1501 family)
MQARRHFLGHTLATATLLSPWGRMSVAATPPQDAASNRFVLLILRGGLCGLTLAPALSDPAFAAARGPLAQFSGEALALHQGFALNPLLPQLHRLYGQGELALLHAVGLPYRERSHFDAQQLLESGGQRPFDLNTGWLGRAVASAASNSGNRGNTSKSGSAMTAVALQTALPLVLRGADGVDSWAPSVLPEPTPDLVARLQSMYRNDPGLAQALARAKGLREDPGMAGNMAADPTLAAPPGRTAMVNLGRKAADFLQRGAQVAVLEMNGWDSHANQAQAQGATSNNLRTLDALLGALREALLPNQTWGRTVVLVATEFGREVAVNGTLGTDHGSGGAALVLGGAVNGGQVFTDWPGLAAKDRFEGRDLRTTTDLRAVIRSILGDHLRVSTAALDQLVLPGSGHLKALPLLRS